MFPLSRATPDHDATLDQLGMAVRIVTFAVSRHQRFTTLSRGIACRCRQRFVNIFCRGKTEAVFKTQDWARRQTTKLNGRRPKTYVEDVGPGPTNCSRKVVSVSGPFARGRGPQLRSRQKKPVRNYFPHGGRLSFQWILVFRASFFRFRWPAGFGWRRGLGVGVWGGGEHPAAPANQCFKKTKQGSPEPGYQPKLTWPLG